MPDSHNFFSKDQKETILNAIREAELNTSGEIRVHIENECEEDVLDRAAFLFGKLKMDQTAQRNGVLFYLAIASRKFAILGDSGINQCVPENFWNEIKEDMAAHFANNEFTEGLTEGIRMAGNSLKEYFPYRTDDVNELSDEISFGEGEDSPDKGGKP
jgi:uncharacterized membrane protein